MPVIKCLSEHNVGHATKGDRSGIPSLPHEVVRLKSKFMIGFSAIASADGGAHPRCDAGQMMASGAAFSAS